MWLCKITNEGLDTLRSDSLELTGTDGTPVLTNDYAFNRAIRLCVDAARSINKGITMNGEALLYARQPSGPPNTDEKTMHIMMHPSENLYPATDDETTYIAKAFETILAEGGQYREVFADPIWVYGTSPLMAIVRTTTSSQSLLFPPISGNYGIARFYATVVAMSLTTSLKHDFVTYECRIARANTHLLLQ